MTLRELFGELDGQRFSTRNELEKALLDVFNRHVTELPIGFSYMDAIEGARAQGWLHANGDGHGVQVTIPQSLTSVG